MKIKLLSTIILSFTLVSSYAQIIKDTTKTNEPLNAVNTLVYSSSQNQNLTIGAYGQIEFTQQFADTARHNALIDVHRIVMFMGYKFNERAYFVSEFEFEHINEAAVEQAFLNYKLNEWADFRAGLMLIPMGIINEYHEPTTFNGSLRPNIDNKIVPSTWREIGAGLTGKFDNLFLKYQVYAMNGFSGYDGSGKFSGESGLKEVVGKRALNHI